MQVETAPVNGEKGAEETEKEIKEENKEEQLEQGLFQMKLPESVKLQMCTLLQYFCDCELRHRVEAITAFSDQFVNQIQSDQRHRYNELMLAFTMSAAETARKTREFSLPVNMLMNFKNCSEEDQCPVPDEVRDALLIFHNFLLAHCVHIEEQEEEEEVKKVREKKVEVEPEPQEDKKPSTLQELISHTMIHWPRSLSSRTRARLHHQRRVNSRHHGPARVLGPDPLTAYCPDGPEEERLMIQSIGNIMSNKVFYQHPNLMRALGMHETVMEVMVMSLAAGTPRRSDSLETVASALECEAPPPWTSCSLLYRQQRASIGSPRARPRNGGEIFSRMWTSELSNALSKGYPDIGWNPCGGEKYLDFLRFAVFVNGESVEENANVVVRLLIRRPECFGPALRGEGGMVWSLAAIEEAIKISEDPARDGPSVKKDRRFPMFGGEEQHEENKVHLGNAIMSFYSALIDLLGRCAPEMHLIQADSFVGKDNSIIEPKMSASFVPDHKAPMVLFLDRVYGIDNQDFLLHVLEVGFLPDMRAAASLDTAAFCTTEMALALNRYLCSAVLPLITKCAPLFAGSDHRAIMIDSMLHTIYRLSRGRAFTKAQRDIIESASWLCANIYVHPCFSTC
ncbi:Ryanodine receptor 1 [Dissostichus eleginoides]|uniref:Ryanodine receptor 1 n=1 Tax=Dissostichus eleginoides TaxID=100907 RepID=A0AAD9EY72_DISEL|nr:Ryanodine receptor 1 [Dissostichus eleginoides]